jgi:hypothetical protein
MTFGFNTTPRTAPARWNEDEAERLRQFDPQHWPDDPCDDCIDMPGTDVNRTCPKHEALTDRDRTVIFESLCARYDELKRMPNGYDFERGNKIGMAEVVDLAAKLKRMGIVALDLEGYAR